ncbi:MAG TPA: DUF2252 family protein [Nitrospiraceae bacterium]|nr:DUF2252 family protein [Nitrospiraceae bacterium]
MLMKIHRATRLYETWLAKQISLVPKDLALKHDVMKRDTFSFLRSTFYRWIQVWPEVCGDIVTSPRLRAIGDAHVENFGTWRDSEGRLIWGVNDFDEAYPLPYTNDLVRLAVSATLAVDTKHLAIKPKNACDALLTGYTEGLNSGGRPFVLAEQHQWLRDIATNKLRDPVKFWQKMEALPPVKGPVPHSVKTAFDHLMPESGLSYRLRRRVSGLGSLGHPRFVALADWQGGKIAREAKALGLSACVWAGEGGGPNTIFYQYMLDQAVRSRDPFVRVQGSWLMRRLSPYCSRIELTALPRKRDEGNLLYAMGWETANVHLGNHKAIRAIRRDLAARKAKWLYRATKQMTSVTISDWTDWRRS